MDHLYPQWLPNILEAQKATMHCYPAEDALSPAVLLLGLGMTTLDFFLHLCVGLPSLLLLGPFLMVPQAEGELWPLHEVVHDGERRGGMTTGGAAVPGVLGKVERNIL